MHPSIHTLLACESARRLTAGGVPGAKVGDRIRQTVIHELGARVDAVLQEVARVDEGIDKGQGRALRNSTFTSTGAVQIPCRR